MPRPAGNSCDPTKWCAALNIDSFSQNAVTGQFNNAACRGLAGDEPVNFAFLTKNGQSQGPADPVDNATSATTFTPDPTKDLFMNSGDTLVVTLRDTPDGLRTDVRDLTTHQSGFMVASVANQFGQVKFDPSASTCTNIPAAFHPMYSTSSEATRVTWAAHSYNIAFADEIGHFDFCDAVTNSGGCLGNEGVGIDREAHDGDDFGCFPASASTLVQVSGCLGTNAGFDGQPYQPVWPDGNTALHPTSILFSSPLTGAGFGTNYSRVAFEADLPRIETAGVALNPTCNRNTGVGCTLIPATDDSMPAAFYPFFSTTSKWEGEGRQCLWQIGNHIPGSSRDFGQNAQYGTLLNLTYTATGGGYLTRYNDFRQILDLNPCRASGSGEGQ